jgi:hypothetical protein
MRRQLSKNGADQQPVGAESPEHDLEQVPANDG